MKLRVSLTLPTGELHDVALSCDVTATVADVARSLVRTGAYPDPHLATIARRRLAPITLKVTSSSGDEMLLDPMAPVAASGLQSGMAIRPVPEFTDTDATPPRLVEVAGYVDVRSGEQRGVRYSLITGSNLIGRDDQCRVQLLDKSVSRRHARLSIEADGFAVLEDLGSVNVILHDSRPRACVRIDGVTEVSLGDVEISIQLLQPAPHPAVPAARVTHRRSPRLEPRFPVTQRTLPSPPAPATPARIPMLALLAPMFMGAALFLITRSPMSLMMVAFTPMMMLGSWLDGTLGGRRTQRAESKKFADALAQERSELHHLRTEEAATRQAETPALNDVEHAIERRSELLWTRRPEHEAFLRLRLGEGTLPGRTQLQLPERADAREEEWQLLEGVSAEFEQVSDIPVTEQLQDCGSLGIAGPVHAAERYAAALIMQLVGLHSPHELTLTCFASPRDEVSWSWLKWLPHVHPVAPVISVHHTAQHAAESLRLLNAIEGLLESRRANTPLPQPAGAVPVVVVLVLDDTLVDTARLITVAESGPMYGIHVVWVGRSREELPAACRTFVEVTEDGATASFVRTATRVPLSRCDTLTAGRAGELARLLAPVEDAAARMLDASDLPTSIHLREIHPVDLLSAWQPIAQAWKHSGSLMSAWTVGQEREPVSLAAIVGQGTERPATVDLRSHGPHALVGGTTGSGKSEFLQTWIMSLAAQVSPDRLNFLLVDYKGGAAFAECVDLPHTVGLVTDLTGSLVHRALQSLRAELRYREELLASHGVKDLIAMERASNTAAPPVLVIVIDEFAALASDVPEFVDGVIDIAQRGRSLGLHMIMATQRPAGVITDNLRANTNLRIALRMADESDSTDVIGVKDAAYFSAEFPGRATMKIGPGRVSHFQTGFLGGRAHSEDNAAVIEVRSLGLTEGPAWHIPAERDIRRGGRSVRDIERLRDGIVAAARRLKLAPPRKPWLEELPARLTLAHLRASNLTPPETDGVLLGLRDDPNAQSQEPVFVSFEETGNVLLAGASGTGKTSALITLAVELTARALHDPVQVYAIDAAGGTLHAIAGLPTVAAVANLADTELVGRVLRKLNEVVAERGPRFAAARANGLAAYREAVPDSTEPRAVLLLDGFAAFRQEFEAGGGPESPYVMLSNIMMHGRAAGVHVVLSCDRPSVLPTSLSASVQQRFIFRLANPHDYGILGVPFDALENAPAGRAIAAGDSREVQFAVAGGEDLSSQLAEIERLADRLRVEGYRAVPRIVNAPTRLGFDELPLPHPRDAVIGLDVRSFEPVTMPSRGLGVIAGHSGSGVSTTALTCTSAVERAARAAGKAVDSVLLSFASDSLESRRSWGRVASGDEEIAAVARDLTVALGGTPAPRAPVLSMHVPGNPAPFAAPDNAGERSGTVDPASVFPAPGSVGVVVIERAGDAESAETVAELAALAKIARRANVLVICEFEMGTANSIWELYQVLKQSTWGIALQPDQHETQHPFREDFGRVKRADFPPGRGLFIAAGSVRPVHVALPP